MLCARSISLNYLGIPSTVVRLSNKYWKQKKLNTSKGKHHNYGGRLTPRHSDA